MIDVPGPQADPRQARARRPARHPRPEEALAARRAPGDFGLGDPFKFPYVTVEAVLPLGRDRARVRQRHELRLDRPQPGLPDYSDFIVLKVPGIKG